MSNDTYTLNIELKNLTGGQVLALRKFFNVMEYNGQIGHSEWVSFYSDGDGNFRPKVKTSVIKEGQKEFQEVDRHIPDLLHLMDNNGRTREISNKYSTFIDFDIYDWYYDYPEQVNITQFLEEHKDNKQVQQILNN